MATPQKIIKFLENSKTKYELLKHKTVYTAYDKAATLKVPEKIVGKTLVVKLDPAGKSSVSHGASRGMALVLIPANKNLDKQKLRKIAKAKSVDASTSSVSTLSSCRRVDFVKENWMKKNLKGVKIGAIPPFGVLWKLPTFIDRGLLQNPKIIINSGDYNYSIKISPAVLKKIIPDLITGNFSVARK